MKAILAVVLLTACGPLSPRYGVAVDPSFLTPGSAVSLDDFDTGLDFLADELKAFGAINDAKALKTGYVSMGLRVAPRDTITGTWRDAMTGKYSHIALAGQTEMDVQPQPYSSSLIVWQHGQHLGRTAYLHEMTHVIIAWVSPGTKIIDGQPDIADYYHRRLEFWTAVSYADSDWLASDGIAP